MMSWQQLNPRAPVEIPMSKREEWMLGGDAGFATILDTKRGNNNGSDDIEKKNESKTSISKKELNPHLKYGGSGVPPLASNSQPKSSASLSWTKVLVRRSLDRVERAEATLEEVAAERFGDLNSFLEACKSVGIDPYKSQRYSGAKDPTTQCLARPQKFENDSIIEHQQEGINKLIARKMKAELKGDFETARDLEKQIKTASKTPARDDRLTVLPRERHFGSTTETDSISQMREHEKLASSKELDDEIFRKIANNKRYGDKMDDLEEMSDRFSERPKRPKPTKDDEAIRKQIAMGNYMKMQKIQERCWFCLDSQKTDKSLIVAYGNFTYLAIPKYGQLDLLHCQIVPIEHASSTLQCEDAVWDEVRNFKKSLLKMAASKGRQMVFLEASTDVNSSKQHCFIDCVPLPKAVKVDPYGYFKKAFLECDAEWSQHKRLFDTTAEGSGGLRRVIPKNFPFLYVDFRLDQGYAHVVEDQERIGNDFLRDMTANLAGIEGKEWKRRLTTNETKAAFNLAYDSFDWTKLLHE